MRARVGITIGDPAGIGPEIVLKALKGKAQGDWLVIGSSAVLAQTARQLGLKLPAGLKIWEIGLSPKFHFGAVQAACGEFALAALEAAVRLWHAGEIQGLVTAPVSKAALRLAGFAYPGQTEFLAARLGVRRYAMMAYSDTTRVRQQEAVRPQALRIVLATIHQPIADVPQAITGRLIKERIRLLDEFLRRYEKLSRPKIAVLALNPHAYEFTCGAESRIARAIHQVSPIRAEGPFPGDTLVQLVGRYDGIVAMYHDQAMIPAKLLAQGKGVNVTLGLPGVRASPLHGTAFDIAGKGIAREDSMVAAIRLCQRLVQTGASGDFYRVNINVKPHLRKTALGINNTAQPDRALGTE